MGIEIRSRPRSDHRQTARSLHQFQGHETRRAARTSTAHSENATGASVDPSKITIAEFLDRWDRDFAAVHVTPKTRERYRQIANKQVVPNIGQVPLQKLRPAHLADLYAKLLKAGLSPRTVGHVHRLRLHRLRRRWKNHCGSCRSFARFDCGFGAAFNRSVVS